MALEVAPGPAFSRWKDRNELPLATLIGGLAGARTGLLQILLLAIALETVVLASPFFLQWVNDGAVASADVDLLVLLAIGFGVLMLVQVAISSPRSARRSPMFQAPMPKAGTRSPEGSATDLMA